MELIQDYTKEQKLNLYLEYKRQGYICLYQKFRKQLYLNSNFNCNYDLKAFEYILSDLTKLTYLASCSNRLIQKQYPYLQLAKVYYSQYMNEKVRKTRCINFISDIFDNYKYVYFLTFTINEKNYCDYICDPKCFLNYTNNSFLRLLPNAKYVYNLDYGSQFQRMHIHCVLGLDFQIDYSKLNDCSYKIGNIDCIRCYNENSHCLTNYINKLSNHAFKDTTLCKCRYSRNK